MKTDQHWNLLLIECKLTKRCCSLPIRKHYTSMFQDSDWMFDTQSLFLGCTVTLTLHSNTVSHNTDCCIDSIYELRLEAHFFSWICTLPGSECGAWCTHGDRPCDLMRALYLAAGWQWLLLWGKATAENPGSSVGRPAPRLYGGTHGSDHCRGEKRTFSVQPLIQTNWINWNTLSTEKWQDGEMWVRVKCLHVRLVNKCQETH